jgi:NADPH:quinone reductase-like Zn-dependent oxidoreductase
MKAIEVKKFGDVDVLEEVTVDSPTITSKQILVKNLATAIDPYDVHFVEGFMGEGDKLPLIPGSSVVGEVIAVGDEVTGFKVGDRVAATRHHKTYAEEVLLGQSMAAKVPDNVDNVTAVAAVLGALTGYEEVTYDLAVQPGEKVLIQGGAGSVGAAAVQVALKAGATVYATAKPADFDFLKSLGDVTPVDYNTAYENDLRDFDAVLDTVGGDTMLKSAKILRPGGRLRALVGLDEEALAPYDIDAQWGSHASKGKQLAEFLDLIAAGDVTIRLAETEPFSVEALRAAHQAVRDHKAPSGKVVLTF